MAHKLYLLVWFLLAIAFPANAQIFEYISTENGLSSRRALSIRQGEQYYIWILTHKGIDRYDGKRFTHYDLLHNGKALDFYPNLNILRTDSKHTVWEIGKDGYLFHYDELKDSFQLAFDLYHAYPELKKRPVSTVYMDRSDRIWMCVDKNFVVYDIPSGTHFSFSRQLKGKIIGIAQSGTDEYYVASELQLYKIKLAGQRLERIQPFRMPSLQLIDYIYYHDSTRQLVINSLLGKVYVYNPQKEKLISLGNSMRDIGINNIIPDRNHPDTLYIASDGRGVYRLDMQRLHLEPFLQEDSRTPNKMNGNIIKDIYMDHAGRLWCAVYPTGITVYTEQYPSYQWLVHSANNANSLANNCINGILEDADGDIWYATSNGISCFDTRRKQWTNYLTSTGKDAAGESENRIFTALCEVKPGLILAGGYMSGIYQIDKPTRRVTFHQQRIFSPEEGPDKYIRCIYRDREGLVWTGGFYRLKVHNVRTHITFLNLGTDAFINWTKEQGLLAASFNPGAAIHSREGQMIFGSSEGAIVLPDSIRLPDEFYNRMVFTDLQIMYRTVHAGEKDSPLSLPLDQTTQIELDYNQNTFSLNVSSINFDNPSDIAYSWKLEGFYDQWSPLSPDGLIQYTNLSPGNYTLRVRAILTDSHQTIEERTIRILIGRPLWLTFWAFLVYALAIIGITYLVVRVKTIRHEKRVSQEKINFFIHTAHDIRTPLTLIKAPLGEIQKDEHLSEKGMTNLNLALQNTESLSDLADNLINFQKESYYGSQATVSRYELNRYLQSYLKQFEAYAGQKHIRLDYTGTSAPLDVWIDRNKMDSILRNLISNALKYTPQGGEIRVKAGCTKNRWTLDISDTGIGIPKEDQKKLFRFLFRGRNAANQLITGSGIGMLLTYRLIRNHEGRISFSSAENTGTTFTLSFPIRDEHYQYRPEGIPDEVTDTGQEQPDLTASLPHTAIRQKAGDEAPLILIVEDNAGLRSFLAESLADTCRTEEAENGQEALDKVHALQPDLIISDVMMPVMDGEKMCGILKSDIETSHIPVILLTALATREDILRGLQTRADMYIVKPFDLTVLKANVGNLLENRALIRKKLRQASLEMEPPAEAIALPTGLDEKFITQVTALIKQSLGGELTVDTLCAGMNMSRTSFYNKIKALTGIAPNEFIRNIRMQEAATLLKSRQYTVAEVSDRMGFADPKYFADTFKKFYGVPPSVFKAQSGT